MLLLWVQFKGVMVFSTSGEVVCFLFLCCPGRAGHDSSSSDLLRPISMPAQSREDHSPLTFSEKETKRRERKVNSVMPADCEGVCVCVCVWYFMWEYNWRPRLQPSCLESHKNTDFLSLVWEECYLPTCWADGWGRECVCVCVCLGKREAAGQQMLHVFLLVSFCFLSVFRLTNTSKKSLLTENFWVSTEEI